MSSQQNKDKKAKMKYDEETLYNYKIMEAEDVMSTVYNKLRVDLNNFTNYIYKLLQKY